MVHYQEVKLQELSEVEVFYLRYNAAGKLVLPVAVTSNEFVENSVTEDEELSAGVRELTDKEISHIRWAFYYLKIYEPQPTADNLEKVSHYLEAFHHFCELAAWEEAWQVLFIRCDTPTREELHNQLRIWGYYRLQIELYNQLLGKLDSRFEGVCYSGLGLAYYSLGEYGRAIEYHQKDLQIAIERGDRAGERRAYGNLGLAYDALGEYHCAIEFHDKCLQIALERGDRAGEGTAYGNLGAVYYSLGEYGRAIKFQDKCLQIALEVGDRAGEGRAYANLGTVYYSLGKYHLAIEFHEKHLQIAIEGGDPAEEGSAYGNLGAAYNSLGEYGRAIEFHQQRLQIAKQIGERRSEAIGYFNLGRALARCDDREWEAIAAYENAQNLYQAMGLAQNVEDCNQAIRDIGMKVVVEPRRFLELPTTPAPRKRRKFSRKWQQLKVDIGNSFTDLFRLVLRWVRSVFIR